MVKKTPKIKLILTLDVLLTDVFILLDISKTRTNLTSVALTIFIKGVVSTVSLALGLAPCHAEIQYDLPS